MNEPKKPRHAKCPECGEWTLVFDFAPDGDDYEVCLNCDYTTYREIPKIDPMADDDEIPF